MTSRHSGENRSGLLENELRQYSKEEGVTMADSVDLRTRVKKLGAKEQARRKKCKLRFSVIKKNEAFQNSHMIVGVKKLLRAGMVSARTWGVLLSLFMELYGLEEEEFSTLATQYWAKRG